MRSGKLWGLLNNQGSQLVEPIYDGFKDAGLAYISYQNGPFWGLMDSSGRILCKPIHLSLWVNPHHWVTYKTKDYIGLADTSERLITRDMFTQIEWFQKDFLPRHGQRCPWCRQPRGRGVCASQIRQMLDGQ
jgi:hypothetical protein